jgi:acyl-CoA synthetase (AMP-forming)/AMP-acid ligase II
MLHVSAEALRSEQRVELTSPRDVTAQQLFSLGSPTGGVSLAIVDPETLVARGEDEVGEVWLDSASKGAGYWGQPELSAATFEARLRDQPGGRGHLRTGDLGFLHGGELYLCGRAKDLLIIAGKNHHPNDVEATIDAACGDVLRPGCAAVFAVELPDGTEAAVACAEVRDPRATDLAAAASALRAAVASQHQIQLRAVVLLKPKTIPKTTSGKIQRQRCRKAYLDGGLAADTVLRDELEPASLQRQQVLAAAEAAAADLQRTAHSDTADA